MCSITFEKFFDLRQHQIFYKDMIRDLKISIEIVQKSNLNGGKVSGGRKKGQFFKRLW
uniref:Uncharacterized protein n=1 Tax=Romanomermis culicivorax TaxID=13658 RepID=A0A915HP83_ROMCU